MNKMVNTYKVFTASRERVYKGLITQELNKQYQVAIDNGGSADSINAKGMNDVLIRLYKDAFIKWGQHMKIFVRQQKRLGQMGFSDDLYEQFKSYFGLEILNTSVGITETTKEIIRKLMTEALRIGYSIDNIVKELQARTGLNAIRARLIARTETTGAANAGSFFTASNSRLVMQKEWIRTYDNRTRLDHRNVTKKRIAMDEAFDVGGYMMMHPGDKGGHDGLPPVSAREVANCRCTLIYHPMRDRTGKLILKN